MRTFAALVFIAGVATAAIWLAGTRTIADGRVLEAEILPAFRSQGVVGLACDREIPVGREGARFGCTASLGGGASQRLECSLERDGRFACKPASGVRRDLASEMAEERARIEGGRAPEAAGERNGHDAPAAGDAPARERIAPQRDPWAN